MSVYSITYDEAWSLAIMLHLPVQPGSVMANWLNTGAAQPSAGDLTGKSLDSLSAKGYYFGSKSSQPIAAGLVNSLALASVNPAELTAVIRTHGKASIVRFAQVGSGIVQYGADEEKLSLHDVVQMKKFVSTFLPAWFKPGKNENMKADLPLGAFLLFKHACAMADWAAGRSSFESETFTSAQLLETFKSSTGWMDVFNAAGVKSAMSVDRMPLDNYLDLLVTQGYLNYPEKDLLEIGAAGKSLAAAFSDPGMCTLTMTLQTWEDKDITCGVFLHGGERLFLLEFISGNMIIRQLADVESGRSWVENLFGKGSHAYYAKYDILSVPSKAAPAVSGASAGGKFCGRCGTAIQQDMKFCSNCGTSIQSAQPKPSTCPGCGKTIKPDTNFCGSCGYKVK